MPEVSQLKEIAGKIQGLIGGINMRDPITQIPPTDLIRSDNVVYDSFGGLSKRLGTATQGTFGDPGEIGISTTSFYLDPPDVPQLIVHTDAGKLYYSVDQGASFTMITDGLSTTDPCSFEVGPDTGEGIPLLFFAEGTQLGTWDGTNYDTVADPPAGVRLLRMWQDTMWAAGSADQTDRVYSSAPGDPLTWPALTFVDILRNDGDQIMGLFTDEQFLAVGKLNRVVVIYDPVLFSNRFADQEKGLESHFSVVHIEDKLYYLSRLGVCWWQGDSPSRLISYNIDRLFRPDILNYEKMKFAYAYAINGKMGWVIPQVGSDYPNLVIENYPRYGPIYQLSGNIGPGPWVFHHMPVRNFTRLRGAIEDTFPDNTETVFGCHPTENKFMEVFAAVGTDDGEAFTSEVEINLGDLGAPIVEKVLRRVRVVGAGIFYLQLRRNYQNSLYVTKLVDLVRGDSEVWEVGPPGPLVMVTDGSGGDAYADIDLQSDRSDFWLSFVVDLDPESLANWVTTSHNQSLALLWSDSYSNLNDTLGVVTPGPRWSTGWGSPAGTPMGTPAGEGGTLVEFHHVTSGPTELYVDGILTISATDLSGIDTRYIRMGQPSAIGSAPSIVRFETVRVGSTRGGTDIFYDTFSGGNLSMWINVWGSTSVQLRPGVTYWGDDPWGSVDYLKDELINLDAYGRAFSIAITDSLDVVREQLLHIGRTDLPVPTGQWSFYEASFEGFLLGVRG